MPNNKSWFDIALGFAASLLLMVMVLLTFADVLGRYLFNSPLRGAFEITELSLLTLIFAGLPLVSRADEHVTMDFIDKMLGPTGRAVLRRFVHGFCGVAILGMAWLMWLKAAKITSYGDTTDVLKIPVGPFVYFMTLTIVVTGLIHLFKMVGPISVEDEPDFDPDKTSTT